MVEIKLTINDPKTGKSYNKVLDTDMFKGKKVLDKIPGDELGLKDYELEIRGGSDKTGCPIRPDLKGKDRKKLLVKGGVGVTIKRKGIKVRKSLRGNELSIATAQVNLKIIKHGSKKVEDLLGAPKEAAAEGEAPKAEAHKEEAKPEAPKEEKKEEAPKEEKKEEVKEEPKEEPKEEKKEEPKEELKEEKKEEEK
ncbi:MAG: 30S ribosomal protein S6e [Nanoarchaeota archaeon]|nr:30S ribosomal protein S6e [Nanoarchaeota archaeon]